MLNVTIPAPGCTAIAIGVVTAGKLQIVDVHLYDADHVSMLTIRGTQLFAQPFSTQQDALQALQGALLNTSVRIVTIP